jgi:hypothetical protein
MTQDEIVAFVVGRWRLEHPAKAIMIQLICLGEPVLLSDVLRIVRVYCDSQSENSALGKRAKA